MFSQPGWNSIVLLMVQIGKYLYARQQSLLHLLELFAGVVLGVLTISSFFEKLLSV